MNPLRKLYDAIMRREEPEVYSCGDGLQAVDIDRIFYELNRGEQHGQKHEEWQHSKEHSKQLEGKVQEEMPRNEVS